MSDQVPVIADRAVLTIYQNANGHASKETVHLSRVSIYRDALGGGMGVLSNWRIHAKGMLVESERVEGSSAGTSVSVNPTEKKSGPNDPVSTVEESLVSLRKEVAYAYRRIVDEVMSELPNTADIQKRKNRFYDLQGLVRYGNELKKVLLDQEVPLDTSSD